MVAAPDRPQVNSRFRLPKAAEIVAANLRRRIVREEIATGEFLPSENDLMEEFGISRPTLREAFRVLESEGLITIRRGSRGGARVQTPDAQIAAQYVGHVLQYRRTTLEDLYAARDIIFEPAAAAVARSRTKADLARLDASIAAENELLDRDLLALVRQEHDFHLLLMELAGNQTLHLLAQTLHHMVEASGRSRVIQNLDATGTATPSRDAARAHRRIVELIREGDAEGADRLWKKHLREVTRFVLSDSQPGEPFELLE